MLNDTLAAALSKILVGSKIGSKEVIINPMSKQVSKVLSILNEEGYLGETQKTSDFRGGVFKVNLLGNINNCGVIKPRHAVSVDDYEKFEKRYLIAKDFGVIIVSTSKGMMTHMNAKVKELEER